MTRTFLVECSGPHWLDIGKRLQHTHHVRPVLWTADAGTIAEARAAFAGIVTIVGTEAACNRLPADCAAWTRKPLDGPLLRALAADEVIGLSMMDRMDPDTGTFDHDSRRRHWYDLLQTWNAALDELRPDVVIFSISPHIVFDFALYALCKHRGVPTRMFERTSLPGQLLLLERFEHGSRELAAKVAELTSIGGALPRSPAALKQLGGLRKGGAEALPPNYHKKLAERGLLGAGGRQAALGAIRSAAFEARRFAYVMLKKGEAPQNYLLAEAADGTLSTPDARSWLQYRWRGQAKKKRLRQMLNRLCRMPDLDRPSVLLALHYQPERAMVPLAGALGDQLIVAGMLSHCLPQGWQLVVKEHPWQLAEMGRGELGRSTGFYQRLASLPHVVLCPPEADTTALLDRCRAVATATGSVGWQSVARGKPALVFGAAWYRGCPGTFAIDSLASCMTAMQRIAAGDAVPARAAETMLAAVELVSFPGFLEPQLEALDGIDQESAVAAMAARLGESVPVASNRQAMGSPT